MKKRSYRFPTAEPHEDWVDGSWTVDCVCGVNFDDGEEMVNCDECGVWVHTRCSRYVKGEELFTCDKCKSKNNVNDSEETEVAQLLVELPTKTFRMENSYGRSGPLRRPFRLWTEIPMEERVHVQGIPGGDPTLFEGLSSIFSRELWKCTGYVPKKFNFKYNDFPCWDKKEKDEAENECEIGHQAENGAGVLFSMSKENAVVAPASALVGMRSLGNKETDSLKLGVKDTKQWDSGVVDTKHSQNAIKKEKSLLHPLLTNKRRKELLGASKDRKKKVVKLTYKEAEEKKCFVHKTEFQPTIDSKPSESWKDRDPEGFVSDVGSRKSEKSKENVPEDASDCDLVMNNGGDETSNTAVAVECFRELQLSNAHEHCAGKQDDRGGHHVRIVLKTSATNDPSSLEGKNAVHNQAKEEKQSTIADTSEDNSEGSPRSSVKPSAGCMVGTAPEVEGKKLHEVCGSISHRKNNLQKEMDTAGGAVDQQALGCVDSKGGGGTSTSQIPGGSEFNKKEPSSSLTDDRNTQYLDRASERVSCNNANKADELSIHPSQAKREVVGSEGAVIAQKDDTLESKPEAFLLQEPLKSCKPPVPSTASGNSRPKVVVCIGKSSSSVSMENSSGFDNPKHTALENSIPGSKQQASDGHASGERGRASVDVVRERDRDDSSGKSLKEHPKYSTSSKSVQQGRAPHSSVSKRNVPDSTAASSSSKVSSAQKNSVSAEVTGSLLNQYSSQLQNKQSSSRISQKGEKPDQPIFRSSSKNPATHSMPPNSKAPLSDEELALLLHQELNSSTRVPRVPRMRQSGSLPQLASPAATSMSIKRTSSSGSKDHGSFSRRKNKDMSKDGFRTSRDVDDRGMKGTKLQYSPDSKVRDSGNRGSYTKGEEYSTRKIRLPPSSTTSTSSGPCSSNELNEHSMPSPHSSPRTTSEGGPVHRTLPGLINEIMSKGKRMTYEELCNAVLPHWPHLRKHNGERYAYSSHSQAVLDCLRNRHEWARLVDRGPKTNSNRKKQKTDAEESDENKTSEGQETIEGGAGKRLRNSKGEDFPKGKRKARKRRRLALQGKDIKELRKKRNEEMREEGDEEEEEEEEEEGAFSDSSEESVFSEEDEREPGGNTARGEASCSSEGTETTS
ncbi:PREDICTED: transcriptional regulator ATRX [Tarenaya hassleriana]|uniref:transcriptional regulator ATRX n=1 Tax=Tarenaya hassleriana TaxID=28532 RepID=UPI00053C7935|nr:PREDICTED: transcriptional regulator ATRX [Tarenaya hassleriana]